jgi:hypothetical protein
MGLYFFLLCRRSRTIINTVKNKTVPMYAKKLLSGSGKKKSTASPRSMASGTR